MQTYNLEKKYTIICPSCNHEFNESDEVSKRANEAAKNEWKQKNDEAIALQKSLKEMKLNHEATFQSQIKKANEDSEKMLKDKYKKTLSEELIRIKNEEEVKNKKGVDKEIQRVKSEFELEKIRAVQNAEKKLVSEHELKIKQKDIIIKQQLVSTDKQRQQLTQSSMQVQGEALEQVVKDHLTLTFSQDVIKDIDNGVNGADIVHKVIYQNTHVGTILLECKNTKSFSNSWLTKLKDEMRELNIEAGLLITQTMPKEEVVTEARKRAIIICSTDTYKIAIPFIREAIYKTFRFKLHGASQKERGEQLIQYLSSTNFAHTFRGLVDLYRKRQDGNKKAQEWMGRYFTVQAQDSEKLSKLLSDTFQGLQRTSGGAIPEIPGLDYSLGLNNIEEV